MSRALPNYACPVCGKQSEMVIGPTQAMCTNTAPGGCLVILFDPSLPDGGLSNAQVVDFPDLPPPGTPSG